MQIQSVSPINYNKQVKNILKSRQNTYPSEPITTGDESTSKSTNFMNKNNISFGLSAKIKKFIGAGIMLGAPLLEKATDTTSSGNPVDTKKVNVAEETENYDWVKDQIENMTETEFQERQKDVLEKISTDPQLESLNDKKITEGLTKKNILVLERFINHPELLKYENWAKNIGDIVRRTRSAEEAKAKIEMIDKIAKCPEFLEIEGWAKNIGDIVYYTRSAEEAKAKIEMIDKIVKHPELLKITNWANRIGDIVNSTDSAEEAQAKIAMIDEIAKHKKLLEIENWANTIGYIVWLTNSAEKAQAKIEMIDKILKHPELLEIENWAKNIVDIVYYTNSEKTAKAKIAMIDKILKHKKLLEDKIGDIVCGTYSANGAQYKIEKIDEIANHPEKHSDEEWMNYRLRKILSVW